MIIYKTTSLKSGKIYIGQDSKDNPNYLGSGIAVNEAIKKYGKENFTKETLAECYTKEQLDFLEKFYIKFFNSKVPNGYNLTDGGEGLLNPSENTKKKMSEALKGKPLSEETKKKMSKKRKGKLKSEETKKKMRKPKSEETKKKMSDSKKGDKNPVTRPEVAKKISQTMKGKKRGLYRKHKSI